MNKAQLKQKSNTTFFDNDQGLIEPAEHRAFNDALVDSVLLKDDTSDVAAKTTPVDGDDLVVADSADDGKLKKITWANIKATLSTYFNNTFAKLASPTFTGAPKAPTPVVTSNDTTIATTAFVKSVHDADLSTPWQDVSGSRVYPAEFDRTPYEACWTLRIRKNKVGMVECIAYLGAYSDETPPDLSYYVPIECFPAGFVPNTDGGRIHCASFSEYSGAEDIGNAIAISQTSDQKNGHGIQCMPPWERLGMEDDYFRGNNFYITYYPK